MMQKSRNMKQEWGRAWSAVVLSFGLLIASCGGDAETSGGSDADIGASDGSGGDAETLDGSGSDGASDGSDVSASAGPPPPPTPSPPPTLAPGASDSLDGASDSIAADTLSMHRQKNFVDEGATAVDMAQALGSASKTTSTTVTDIGTGGVSGSTFQDYGFNPPVDPAVDPLSTFALDVDTASYTVSRNFLNNRQLPPPEAVRVEEFVNYFDGGYLQRMGEGQDAGTFLISLDATAQQFSSDGRVLLRVGIQAPTEFAEMVVPDSVVLVVDRSGSMDGYAGGSESLPRYRLVHQAVELLLEGLPGDTRLGLVAYSDSAATIFDPVVVSENAEWIMQRVRETIIPTNSTNVEDGLKLGYEMALNEAQSGRNVLVLLLSDGVANVGATSSQRILDEIGRRADIGLSTIGVGLGSFNDALMEQLANSADGTYHYIDTPDEARRIFVDNLASLLTEAARDAKIQVEFNLDSVDSYRLLGFENRAIPDEDFRDDTREAGKVGLGQSSTAIYELELNSAAELNDLIAEVTLRYTKPRSESVTEQTGSITVGEVGSLFSSADVRFRLAVVAAQFAELLRRSPYLEGFDISKLIEEARAVASKLSNDSEAVELSRLIETAKDLGLSPPDPVPVEGQQQ